VISSNIGGAAAYAAIQGGLGGGAPPKAGQDSFSGALESAMTSLTEVGRQADAKSVEAMSGSASLTDVVMAVSKAEMALQTTVAVRDKVVSAYQDIMRMAV